MITEPGEAAFPTLFSPIRIGPVEVRFGPEMVRGWCSHGAPEAPESVGAVEVTSSPMPVADPVTMATPSLMFMGYSFARRAGLCGAPCIL